MNKKNWPYHNITDSFETINGHRVAIFWPMLSAELKKLEHPGSLPIHFGLCDGYICLDCEFSMIYGGDYRARFLARPCAFLDYGAGI